MYLFYHFFIFISGLSLFLAIIAFAFLYTTSFKLRKLLQEKKVLNSLTKEAKEKNGEHMPTLETSDEIKVALDEIKVKELRGIYNDNDTFLDLIIIFDVFNQSR